MIDVELKVGKPVQPKYRDTFVLSVGYMHGDADGTTVQEYRYPKEMIKDLEVDIAALHCVSPLYPNDVIEFLENEGVGDARARGAAIASNFWEGDITCEGERAPVESINVHWYDADGVKHGVNVLIHGNEI